MKKLYKEVWDSRTEGVHKKDDEGQDNNTEEQKKIQVEDEIKKMKEEIQKMMEEESKIEQPWEE